MTEPNPWHQLVMTLLGSLIGHPDAVKLKIREEQRGVVISAEVHPDDVGRVIGKGGANIAALRTLVAFVGEQQGISAALDLKNS